MNTLFLRIDEYIIATDYGFYYRGPLANGGNIYLTNERLYFEPTGTVDKLAGAKEVSILLEDIDLVDIQGIDKIISIQTEENTHRFPQP